MTLDEQRNMMEHALTERMLNHAFVVLRQWAQELGFAPYVDRIHSLEDNYKQLFDYYLIGEDPERDAIHDQLTTEVYRLADEMYSDMCLKQGKAPEMRGFDRTSIASITNYFTACVHLQEEDYDWLVEAANDPQQATMGFVAVAALSANLREAFNEESLMTLIEVSDAENQVVADQALASLILLLAQWDTRVDFFPQMQEAFIQKIGDGERAYLLMRSLVRASNKSIKEMVDSEHITPEDIPEELQDVLGSEGAEGNIEDMLSKLSKLVPKTEHAYIQTIVELLPETWVFDVIIGEDEQRAVTMDYLYLELGSMGFMWDCLDEAEEWLLERLRSGKAKPQDYINYAHCCFLKGDKMMAFENYLEAKRQCKSTRTFFDLFRPDRKMLVEKGIPLEQVYLMEDHLLKA